MVVDYTIACGYTPEEVIKNVRALLRQGWQPLGGVMPFAQAGGQAMVKWESSSDTNPAPSAGAVTISPDTPMEVLGVSDVTTLREPRVLHVQRE